MKILNGKELAQKTKEEVKKKILYNDYNPYLVVIQVGNDPASSVYVKNKEKACEYCGISVETIVFSENVEEYVLLSRIKELNKLNFVSGILVQLPLPAHIDTGKVLQTIAPEKDVDGFHISNAGKLLIGKDTFVPCTAEGIIELLKANDIELEGKNCVVVGRSNIVGKPVALELLHNNATVTICHSKTKNLKEICLGADILICAIGKPKFFNREYISYGTVVVDVGIHRTKDGLCGDVDFEDVKEIAGAITPVPGGVGPMTVAMLMKNVVKAARR